MDAHVVGEPHAGQVELLGHDEHVAEHFGPAFSHGHAAERDAALFRIEQAAHEVEQSALAGAVLAEQAVDAARSEREGEVLEDGGLAPPVAEVDVFDV